MARALRITYPGAFYHVTSRGVELVSTEDKLLARNVKMYLCQRHSGKKLKEIGVHFWHWGIEGITELQACGRKGRTR